MSELGGMNSMETELKLEESRFHDLKLIEPGFDSIKFTNKLGIEVDSITLTDYLSEVKGIGQIQSLSISYSSQLIDLKVIRAFPNLRNISVYGYKITSLVGLEWFHQGEFIEISTETNRRRRITEISRAPIKRMFLQFARSEDLDDIAECLTLNDLDLHRSKDLDFFKWGGVPIKSLGLVQGKFKELGNTADIISLEDIRVLGCRSLERFTGDNSRITWMVISGCKKLDLRTIQTFQGIKALTVNGNSNEIRLTEIGELKHLENLMLIDCNIQIDTSNLKHQFPRLKELHISNMKKEQVMELNQANPDIMISGK